MDTLFILSAEYLYWISVLVLIGVFYKLPKNEKKKFFIFVLMTFALSYIIAVCARQIYDNPRPFVVGNFQPLLPHEADNGFPSDHTLLVSAIASVVIFYRKKIAIALWIIAMMVAASRVYVGVHHPLDVAASILIASFSSLAVHLFLQRIKHDKITQ